MAVARLRTARTRRQTGWLRLVVFGVVAVVGGTALWTSLQYSEAHAAARATADVRIIILLERIWQGHACSLFMPVHLAPRRKVLPGLQAAADICAALLLCYIRIRGCRKSRGGGRQTFPRETRTVQRRTVAVKATARKRATRLPAWQLGRRSPTCPLARAAALSLAAASRRGSSSSQASRQRNSRRQQGAGPSLGTSS